MQRTQFSRAVPVQMGSVRSVQRDVGPLRLTHATFPAGACLDTHVHDRATFGVMLSGGFDLRFASPALGRRSYEIGAGWAFTEPAGETHGNDIGAGGADVLVVQVDPESPDAAVAPFRSLLLDEIHHLRHARVELNARSMVRELERPDALSDLALEALVLEALVHAGRLVRAGGRDGPPWLRRAEDLVRDRFREALRIADVAEAVGVHPAHLASVFRDKHGIPLGAFIRRLRLEWSADRLARSADSLSSIAYAAGFADQSHFTRAFKRYTGLPPGAYRRARA
ncbi:MAG: helix-turn-helix domain-containing protein [Gemmatimonadota bacterium]